MIPYLFLTGRPKVGKTAMLKLIGDIYDVEPKSSQSVKTEFSSLVALSESKKPLLIEEGHSLFEGNKNKYVELLKANASSTKEVGARGRPTLEVKSYYGQRTASFTMNFNPDISDSGMRRRMVGIDFLQEDIASEEDKEKFRRLKVGNYINHLEELFFYLHICIIKELNNSKDSFLDCVDRVLKENNLEEYTLSNIYWSDDTLEASEYEDEDIEEEMYSIINSELARHNKPNALLLEEGFIPGLRGHNGKFYITSAFVSWFNSKTTRPSTSLTKLGEIINNEAPKVVAFRGDKNRKSVMIDQTQIHFTIIPNDEDEE